MKSIRNLTILVILSLSLALSFEASCEPKKNNSEPIGEACWMNEIPGTILFTNESSRKQFKSGWNEHSCSIGLRRSNEKTMQFSPILELPTLINDWYVIKFDDGIITVTTKKGKATVVTLNLKSVNPSLITKLESKKQNKIIEFKILP